MYLHVSYTGEDETSHVSISVCTLCVYVSVCLSISLSVFVSIGNAFGSVLRAFHGKSNAPFATLLIFTVLHVPEVTCV